jgi:ferrochelatase
VRYRAYVGMRHWHPYIAEVVPRMLADGVERIVAIVMAPHFSRMSVGAYMGKLEKALSEAGSSVPVAKVASWKDEPAFVDAIAQRIVDALQVKFLADARASVPILFTAHSLPARILESNDPYPRELEMSVAEVVELVQPKHWRWAYQSQGASAEPWLGPTVEETLEALAAGGHRHVLLVPIGFVCDHVEVLYDVDIEHRQQAAELGIQLERIEMLNDDPGLVAAVANAVRRAAAESLTIA